MNKYIGKTCPFCKTDFVEGDDIVICSDCEMPHHKDCWIENQGCTTFGCMGSISNANGSNNSVTSNTLVYDDSAAQTGVIFCGNCGKKNSASGTFCVECGSALSAPVRVNTPPVNTVNPNPAPAVNPYVNVNPVPPVNPYANANPVPPVNPYANANPVPPVNPYANANPVPPVTPNVNTGFSGMGNGYNYNGGNAYGSQGYSDSAFDAEMNQMIQTNQSHYVNAFRSIKTTNNYISWNWSAFLFSSYWLIYRKMYIYGIALLVVCFLLSFIPVLGLLLNIAVGVAVGLFGNYLYLKTIEPKANSAKNMTEPYKTQFLLKEGGVSMGAAVIAAVAYGIISLIVNII